MGEFSSSIFLPFAFISSPLPILITRPVPGPSLFTVPIAILLSHYQENYVFQRTILLANTTEKFLLYVNVVVEVVKFCFDFRPIFVKLVKLRIIPAKYGRIALKYHPNGPE